MGQTYPHQSSVLNLRDRSHICYFHSNGRQRGLPNDKQAFHGLWGSSGFKCSVMPSVGVRLVGTKPHKMWLSPPPTMKETGQESGGELCGIFKLWSFPQSKSVNNVCKLLQLPGVGDLGFAPGPHLGISVLKTLGATAQKIKIPGVSTVCTHFSTDNFIP